MINYKRNEHGLVEGVEYKFTPEGRIDWRAMIRPEHLVINKKFEKELLEKFPGKKLEEIPVTEIEDKYLIILLAGIKELAHLRGYVEVEPKVSYSDEKMTVVQTTITWEGNFETGGIRIKFGDVASASPFSLSEKFVPYSASIAANRAFVRAVRNFLGINIVGDGEMKAEDLISEESESKANASKVDRPTPQNILAKTAENKSISFDMIKLGAEKKYKNDLEGNPETWSSFKDISSKDCYILIQKLKESTQK